MNEQGFVITDGLWGGAGANASGQEEGQRGHGPRYPFISGSVALVDQNGFTMARPADVFGNWNSEFRRFRRGADRGVFESLFKAISGDPDLEYALIDGTIVSVHQKAAGAKGGPGIRPSGVCAAD